MQENPRLYVIALGLVLLVCLLDDGLQPCLIGTRRGIRVDGSAEFEKFPPIPVVVRRDQRKPRRWIAGYVVFQ